MNTKPMTYRDMVAESAPSVDEIFPWDLLEERETGVEMLLLDIRCPHEYQDGHIEGSLNVPRGILELACDYGYEETLPTLVEARQRRVVVICRSGNRSILAARTLQQMGYRRAASLRTGLRGCSDYEQPLVDRVGRPLSLEQADELFVPLVSREQLGPGHHLNA